MLIRTRGAVLFLAFVLPGVATAADWPQWRGPSRDSVAEGVTLPAKWPAELKRKWSVAIGEGHSGPVVVGNRVYQFARSDDVEVLLCLNLTDGSEVWRARYAAPYEMHDAARPHGKGPKSTPAVADGRVFTLGIGGILSCFDAEKGTLFWRKEFAKEFKTTSPLYGTASSPLVDGALCIAHVGGHDKGRLAAFDVKIGDVRWTATEEGPGYASPVIATLAGRRQLITLSQRQLHAFDSADGKLLWKVPFATEYDQNAITPVVAGDLVIYSGYNQSLAALRVVKRGDGFDTEAAWSNKSFPLYMSTPVVAGDRLVGFSQRRSGQAFCVKAATGETVWESDGRLGENAALIRIGDAVLMLTTEGRLLVLDVRADRFRALAEYGVADSPTWAHPALVERGILVKDKTRLTLWSWGE